MPVVLYVLFTLSVVPIAVAWLAAWFRYRELGAFDNHHPRLAQGRQTGIGARALAAQQNSWETLQVFLLVVFIAYVSPLPLDALATVSVLFLVIRLLYIVCYLANWGWVRSGVYVLGMACCLYIFGAAVMSYSS